MRLIPPYRLNLGTALDARNLRLLYEREIAAVVDLAIEEPPAQLGRDIIYCRFPLIDGSGNSPPAIRLAIDTVASLIRNETRTLVACGAGMSRSPAIVAAALSLNCDKSPDGCLLDLVQGQPHDVSPQLWVDVKKVLASK
jgi:hypothetical protein